MGGAVSRAASKVISVVAKPALTGIKGALKGVLGSAKQSAKSVAHQAIGHAATAGQEALQTGNLRGAAKSAFNNVKRDAIGAAKSEFDSGKAALKAEASKHLKSAHQKLLAKVKGSGVSVGAGFGKAQLKQLERVMHKHINKIYSGAHKHVKKSYGHIRKNGRPGINRMKKDSDFAPAQLNHL